MMVKRLLVLGMIVLMLILGTSSEAKELQSSPPPDTRKSAGTSETATLKTPLSPDNNVQGLEQWSITRTYNEAGSLELTFDRLQPSGNDLDHALVAFGDEGDRQCQAVMGASGAYDYACLSTNKERIEGHAVLSDSSLWDIYLGAWGGNGSGECMVGFWNGWHAQCQFDRPCGTGPSAIFVSYYDEHTFPGNHLPEDIFVACLQDPNRSNCAGVLRRHAALEAWGWDLTGRLQRGGYGCPMPPGHRPGCTRSACPTSL